MPEKMPRQKEEENSWKIGLGVEQLRPEVASTRSLGQRISR
jgi:hypothetical protein